MARHPRHHRVPEHGRGARSWYESPAYQRILPLRTDHIASDAILVEGVEPGHDSARMAVELRNANWAPAPVS